jgi:hypothetical protein
VFILAFLIAFVLFKIHKDIKIDKYIRTDCQFFDHQNGKVKEYFGERNEAHNKKVLLNSVSGNQETKKTDNHEMTAIRRNSENKFVINNNINSSGEINTERGLQDDNINNKDNHLVLDKNKTEETAPKATENVVLYNNFANEEAKDEKIIETNDSQEEIKKLNQITLRDYECLMPEYIPIHDLRPIGTYMKDEIFNNHRLLSVIFKQSIKDPVIIRSTKLLFHTCSNFAFSALCFTDSYIEEQAKDPSVVKYLFIKV